MGDDWYGLEFWYVCTELGNNPSQMADTWSPAEVLEAYYYLRLAYLKNAPGGA